MDWPGLMSFEVRAARTRGGLLRGTAIGTAAMLSAPLLGAVGRTPVAAASGDARPRPDVMPDAVAGPAGVEDVSVDEFRAAMRRLWEDHVTWTRLAIISLVAGLPDAGPTVQRLLQNQDDIGNAIRPVYGTAAGTQLAALLREHITTAADLVAAAKAGNAARAAAARTAWYANADAIAAFLNAANPANWSLDTVKMLMRMHLDQTLEEAAARIAGNWAADVAAYDKIHAHILVMADALTMGIVAQFPEKFVTLAPAQAAIPDLRGLAERDAVAAVHAAGFSATASNMQTVDQVVPEAHDYFLSIPAGKVVSQVPAPGTMSWKGSPVLLAVRKP